MPKTDTKLVTRSDLIRAVQLLSRLPLRAPPGDSTRPIAASAWAWPLIGGLIGLLAGLTGLVVAGLGAGPGIAAGATLAAMMMLTGALHEDGLADSADGLWGGHDKARRLEIMRDSRVGSYGVLALGLSLILRWSALVALMQAGWFLAPVIAIAMLSRVPMVVLIAALPNARSQGLAASAGQPERPTILLAIVIALIAGLVLVGWSVVVVAFWISLSAIAIAALAKAKIDGQTGDILGASQQVAEIAALAALAAIAI